MCGIAGVYRADGRPIDRRTLSKVSESMVRRGPDGSGVWVSDGGDLGLAHRRLSILDMTDRGAQPMPTPDGRFHIVFNGEIYNYPELRRWCESRGVRFRSDSDTEVLLHLYALLGIAFLHRLRGMYAFAVWDTQEQQLVLARDPLGIKPLYYAEIPNEFAFASQVKALQHGGYGGDLSPAGIASFMIWGYVTDPHTTVRGIRALPAGHVLIIGRGRRPSIAPFCDALAVLRNGSSPKVPETELRDMLVDSVSSHLLSDVPVGVFLSAGIDSSAICALAAQHSGDHKLHGITLGFAEYAGTSDDEVPGSVSLAHRYGIEHHVVRYTRHTFAAELERFTEAMDQPSVDGVNSYFVSKAAAEHGLKVALSGIGGDELFGSYPSFSQVPRIARTLRIVPRSAGRRLDQMFRQVLPERFSPKLGGVFQYGGSVPGAYLLRRALFMPWELSAHLTPDIARQGLEELDLMGSLDSAIRGITNPHDQVFALEAEIYMRNCLLRDADWAGMAHSVEIRTPLADLDLYRQVVGLRARNSGRPISKQDVCVALATDLDAAICQRPKTGFSVPTRQWLAHTVARLADGRGLRPWARYLLESIAGQRAFLQT